MFTLYWGVKKQKAAFVKYSHKCTEKSVRGNIGKKHRQPPSGVENCAFLICGISESSSFPAWSVYHPCNSKTCYFYKMVVTAVLLKYQSWGNSPGGYSAFTGILRRPCGALAVKKILINEVNFSLNSQLLPEERETVKTQKMLWCLFKGAPSTPPPAASRPAAHCGGVQKVDQIRMRNSNIYFSNIFRKFIIHKQVRARERRFKFKLIHLPSGPRDQEHHTVSGPRRAPGADLPPSPPVSQRAWLAGLLVGCENTVKWA